MYANKNVSGSAKIVFHEDFDYWVEAKSTSR